MMLARWGVLPGARWIGNCAEHDPWRYASQRMMQTGAADIVLSVSSFAGPPPKAGSAGAASEKLIALAPDSEPRSARIVFETGASGVDYDAQWYDETEDAVINRTAKARSSKPSPASILDALKDRMGEPAR
jgi:hypothetical protein